MTDDRSVAEAILESIGALRECIGEFREAIKALKVRGQEDRDRAERRHSDLQAMIGDLRQTTSASIAEQRRVESEHWDKTTSGLEALSEAVGGHGAKLDAHARLLGSLQSSRGRLMILASIGGLTLLVIGRAIEDGAQWVFDHLLRIKFGG